jgi:hypothetical protein
MTSMEALIPRRDTRLDSFSDRLDTIESNLSTTGKKSHLTRESVQQIASALAFLTGSHAVQDNTLPDTLQSSMTYITQNITNLYEELQKMKDREQLAGIIQSSIRHGDAGIERDDQFSSASPEKKGSQSQPNEIEIEVEPRHSRSGQAQRTVPAATIAGAPPAPVEAKPGERTIIEKRVVTREIIGADPLLNFAEFRPYPAVAAHWSDPPELPPIYQFKSLGNFVDYFYRVMPKLQAHLTAIQGKIVDLDGAFDSKVDRGLVEKMFDRFHGVVSELKNGLDDLKNALEQTATREEINGIIEDLLGSLNMETETSIGRVKCIACGREMNKVAGALTEAEIARALGNPPNSIAFHASASHAIGVAFQSREGFDSAIVESPRALRPCRPIPVRPKLKTPHPSS